MVQIQPWFENVQKQNPNQNSFFNMKPEWNTNKVAKCYTQHSQWHWHPVFWGSHCVKMYKIVYKQNPNQNNTQAYKRLKRMLI